MAATPVSLFGKDHWSLLAYVECCCVDGENGIGRLVRSRMRTNENTHPLLRGAPVAWKVNYSTRLRGFFEFNDRSDPAKAIAAGLMLEGHDDWDCLDDLEAAGYLEVLTLVQGCVQLTEAGLAVAAKLREHKAKGGQFAGFSLEPAASEA